MWFDEAIIYQIYPIGFCGAPLVNDRAPSTDPDAYRGTAPASAAGYAGVSSTDIPSDSGTDSANHSLLRIRDWIPHIKKLGASCLLLNPLFESDAHGYDTRDYYTVDHRLGTNGDLVQLCEEFHKEGISILFDGVFNHVGRGFWAFQDVLQKRWDSPYKDWFHISFDGNNSYNDGLWYKDWEGASELVKLNLSNPQVREYIFNVIREWVKCYHIDGLRLDVAYCLDRDFLAALRNEANRIGSETGREFVLLGETLHGDYNLWMNDNACHSVTNYECYKGLYSSFNSANMHEISYSLNRQYGAEHWCLYTGRHLLSFVDNHDVTRIASILTDKRHLPLLYGMIYGMPGVPAVYYGSEWGAEGDKKNGDPSLRPCFDAPVFNELSEWIARLSKARSGSRALCYGSYRNLMVQPRQLIFERETEGERVIVAINSAAEPYHADFDARSGLGTDLITGETHDFGAGSELPPYSCSFWRTER